LELLEQRLLLSTIVSFDSALGSLSLLGAAAGSTVAVEGMSNGAIGVLINGQLHCRAPGVSSFDPTLAGASTTTLHQINLSGGGSADALTLNSLTGDHLAVTSDGSISLTGSVTEADRLAITARSITVEGAARAALLVLTSTGLLDIASNGNVAAVGNGGSITAAADNFVNVGQVRADGAKGGTIAIRTRDYLNAGTVSAAGSAGSGGTVVVNFTDSYIDTTAAWTTARSKGSAGGVVSIDGGSSGRLLSSGAFDVTGASGGDINLYGQNIFLVATTADASGTASSGGRIRIGGDYQARTPPCPMLR
jgi:hypothetical protein